MSVSLDRFAHGLPDPQAEEPTAVCEGCGEEIYPGEDVYLVNGHILHNDWECLARYIDPEVMTVEEAARGIVGV